MTRVYVPSTPMVRDPRTGGRAPKFDLSPAREFGELTDVFGGDGLPPAPSAMAALAAARMADYRDGEDYVLLTGDPAAIALTIALAARRGGVVRLLKWVRGEWRGDGHGVGRYIVLNVDLDAAEKERR